MTQAKSTRMNKQKKRDPESRKKAAHRNQILNDLDVRISRQGLQQILYICSRHLKENMITINVHMGEISAKKWKHEMKNKKQKIF